MNENLIEIKPSSCLRINLMYAGTRNMFRRAFYKELGLDKCYAHRDMLPYLERLQKLLSAENLILEIRDCYRPLEVQALMWEYLPDDRYLAPRPAAPNTTKARRLIVPCLMRPERNWNFRPRLTVIVKI